MPPRAARGGTPRIVLTERQEDVLVFIASYTAEKKYPPSNKDIREHFGWGSSNTVADHLEALARKHCLTWEPHLARTLQLTEAGRDAVARRQGQQQTEAPRHA
ncbi:LexA family protein [Corallococcus sp. 4LFB]|uniref:LexA family protein n=1 Tax=Corallococcus sp. 4LFB TaxID=3383249 RepID=UPI003975FC62